VGTWNDTQVALKVLKTEGGIMPSSTVRLQLPLCGSYADIDPVPRRPSVEKLR